jgi:microcompartment protein CcmL/EutN
MHMIRTLGLIELNSIARGYYAADIMLKAAEVELIKAHSICPGKFVVLIGGDVGAVKAAVAAGIEASRENCVDHLVLPNLSSQVIPAIMGCTMVTLADAMGVMEFFSIASAVTAADMALKAANVALVDLRLGFAIGGKASVTLTGDVSAVTAAVEAGSRAATDSGLLVQAVVIPRPHPGLKHIFL